MLKRRASKQQLFVSLTSFTYNERGLFAGGNKKRQKNNPVEGLATKVTGLRQRLNHLISLLLWANAPYTSSESYLGNP